MTIDDLVQEIGDELVGVWKFKTLDEGPAKRRWCASVNVCGRLIDTEDFPTIGAALGRAVAIVRQLKKSASAAVCETGEGTNEV